jgi:chromosome segregation ATPase
MPAEINELFEEGITRSRELSDAADEAMRAIEAMAGEAEQLAQKVEEEGKQAGQHARDLAARLEEAGHALEAGRGHADGAMEALTGKAGELEAELTSLLDRVTRSMQELDADQKQHQGTLDTEIGAAESEFGELARATQEAGTHLEQHLQEAEQAVSALRAAVDAARTDFAHQQESWASALQALETAAHTQSEACAGALRELLAQQARSMVEAANAMVDQHNTAMQEIRHRFVEQAPQDLATALHTVEGGLEHMGDSAARHGQVLTSTADELSQTAQHEEPQVEAVQSALEAALHVA